MTREQMIAKLNRKDFPGVGVMVTMPDDTKRYYYYEDTEEDHGIDRASKHFFKPICNREVKCAEYFYNDRSIEFYLDWKNAPGNWSVSDYCIAWNHKMKRETCYKYGIVAAMIDGKACSYDYKVVHDGIIAVFFKDNADDIPEYQWISNLTKMNYQYNKLK